MIILSANQSLIATASVDNVVDCDINYDIRSGNPVVNTFASPTPQQLVAAGTKIASAAPSQQLLIGEISFSNTSAGAVSVAVYKVAVASADKIIANITIPAGSTAGYENGYGWYMLDANGIRISTTNGTVSAGTIGQVAYYAASGSVLTGAPGFTVDGAGNLISVSASSWELRNASASSTVPSIVPNKADITTGFGSNGAATISVVVSGAEVARWIAGGVLINDANNIQLGTATGTKIGTAANQKLGFFNATPVVQPSTTGTSTGFTAGAGTNVTDQSTFTGGTGSTAYRISDIVLALKSVGLLAS